MASRSRVSSVSMRVGAGDRPEVAGHQEFGLQLANALDRVDGGQRVPVAVAAHRDQVGNVAEDRAEGVAAQADPLVGQPDDHRVVGFSARHGDQFQPATPDLEGQRVVEDEVGGTGCSDRAAAWCRTGAEWPGCRWPGCL